MYKFSLKTNVKGVLKVHCQSNLLIIANSETKTFKNIITLKSKTLNNRGI